MEGSAEERTVGGMEGRTDGHTGWTDKWMHIQMDGRMDGWTDGWTDEWRDHRPVTTIPPKTTTPPSAAPLAPALTQIHPAPDLISAPKTNVPPGPTPSMGTSGGGLGGGGVGGNGGWNPHPIGWSHPLGCYKNSEPSEEAQLYSSGMVSAGPLGFPPFGVGLWGLWCTLGMVVPHPLLLVGWDGSLL